MLPIDWEPEHCDQLVQRAVIHHEIRDTLLIQTVHVDADFVAQLGLYGAERSLGDPPRADEQELLKLELASRFIRALADLLLPILLDRDGNPERQRSAHTVGDHEIDATVVGTIANAAVSVTAQLERQACNLLQGLPVGRLDEPSDVLMLHGGSRFTANQRTSREGVQEVHPRADRRPRRITDAWTSLT